MREETEKAMLKKCTKLNIQMIGVEHQLLLVQDKLDAMCAENKENVELTQVREILENIQKAFQETLDGCYDLYQKVNSEANIRDIRRLVSLRLDAFEEEIESVKKQISLQ